MRNILGKVKGSAVPEQVKIYSVFITGQGELALTHVLNALSELRAPAPFKPVSALREPPQQCSCHRFSL